MKTLSICSRGTTEDYTWDPPDKYSRLITRLGKSEMSPIVAIEFCSDGFSVLLAGLPTESRQDRIKTPIRNSLLFDGLSEKEARSLVFYFLRHSETVCRKIDDAIINDNSTGSWTCPGKADLDNLPKYAVSECQELITSSDNTGYPCALPYSDSYFSNCADYIQHRPFPKKRGILLFIGKFLTTEAARQTLDESALFVCSKSVDPNDFPPKKSVSVLDFPGNGVLLLASKTPRCQSWLNSQAIFSNVRNADLVGWSIVLVLIVLIMSLLRAPVQSPLPPEELKKKRK
jgi:hypothetical protein